MRSPYIYNPEERIFTLDDVKELFLKLKKPLLFVAILGAIFSALFICFLSPRYTIEASFKERSEDGIRSSSALLQNFIGISAGGEKSSEAFILMKSFRILRPLIEKLGLQAEIPEGKLLRSTIYYAFLDTCKAQMKMPLEDLDPFIFQNIIYEGDSLLECILTFQDGQHFTISRKGADLISGTLGIELQSSNFQLTLSKTPKTLKIGKPYPLLLSPWMLVAETLRKKIQIKPNKVNSSILELVFSHRDRQLAAQILNELMSQYQHYLKSDHDQVALEQLVYLNQKQKQIYDKMSHLFQEHADYLKSNLENRGMIALKDEMETVLAPYHKFQQMALNLDLELNRIEQIEGNGQTSLISYEGPFASRSQELVQMLENLKQQKEMLETSSHYVAANEWGPKPLSYGEAAPSHFDGIDLKTARALFIEYNKKLDQSEELIRCYENLVEKIGENSFEIGSLSSALKDPLSQTLIAEASKVAIQLKNEKYHSTKEGERWLEELVFQKKVLLDHIEQLHKLELLNSQLIQERMGDLQRLSLHCINREMSALYETIARSLKERKGSLSQEKKIIERKMEELISASTDLPEKWRQEKWLDLNMQMGLKIIEVMTELVEEKTMAHHLHHVESKSLDWASMAPLACSPHLFLFSALGAAFSALFVFFVSFVRTLFRGFPITLDKLKNIGYPAIGSIASLPSSELFHRMALFIGFPTNGKVISLIGGRGPDYSHFLEARLSSGKLKPLCLRPDFSSSYSKGFQELLESAKKEYDLIFLISSSPLSSAESLGFLSFSDLAIVTVSGESIEELTPFMEWGYHKGDHCLTFVVFENEKI